MYVNGDFLSQRAIPVHVYSEVSAIIAKRTYSWVSVDRIAAQISQDS